MAQSELDALQTELNKIQKRVAGAKTPAEKALLERQYDQRAGQLKDRIQSLQEQASPTPPTDSHPSAS